MWNRAFVYSAIIVGLSPSLALACACGCGVFDVGTGTMLPTDAGGTVWMEYDFMNQSRNWSGSSSAPSSENTDKLLRTSFFVAGGEYMFNRSWGIEAQIPYTERTFRTTEDDGSLGEFRHSALGDVQVKGVYSGFEEDMSSGVTLGFKLPTGDYQYPSFDRDTEIGSGSTDLLLGGYHMGRITQDNLLSWFVDGQFDTPFMTQGGYRPGDEIDMATGMYYDAGSVYGQGKLSPLLQIIGSYRWRDSGVNADPTNTGYNRLLLSPGLEYDVKSLKLYGDVEVPVYQHVNGDQLTAPVYFKLVVAYDF